LPDLKASPFRPEQVPEANGAILKCRISPKNLVAWWTVDLVAHELNQDQANLLVDSLREHLQQFVK